MILIVSHELAGPEVSHVYFARNAVAPENIGKKVLCAVVAAVPVHEEMSWLNAEAELNIVFISVTCAVFQLPMSWLNAEAETNIYSILVTSAVFQLPMSWLNEEEDINIPNIVVTFPVFQPPMSWLNAEAA